MVSFIISFSSFSFQVIPLLVIMGTATTGATAFLIRQATKNPEAWYATLIFFIRNWSIEHFPRFRLMLDVMYGLQQLYFSIITVFFFFLTAGTRKTTPILGLISNQMNKWRWTSRILTVYFYFSGNVGKKYYHKIYLL